MPQRWRPVICIAPFLLAACGGGKPPLQTIEPIRGSRTSEGNIVGEIVPIRGGQARPDTTPLREIRPITVPHGPADTLLGTTWNGEGLDGEITFEFLGDGILRYTTADSSYTNGTWQQSGNTISFEMNARFAEWTGRIEAARMAGAAHNSAGRRWNWQATRR